jgi:hypothetical protein
MTAADFMAYSIIAVIALIALLALKEILSAESHKNRYINSFVKGSNIVIVPLLLVFVSIVAFKVATVI